MTWYGWAVVAYIAIDRILTVALVGQKFDITPSVAVVSLVTGTLLIWAVVTLGATS